MKLTSVKATPSRWKSIAKHLFVYATSIVDKLASNAEKHEGMIRQLRLSNKEKK